MQLHLILRARSLTMCAALGFLLCVVGALAQSTTQGPAGKDSPLTDKRLMSDADFMTFLLQVDSALPKWETALKSIEPEKDSQISYALGKMIVENRDIGLMDIGNIHTRVAKLRVKRTVSDELVLSLSLQTLSDSIEEEVGVEAIANMTLSDLEKLAPELTTLRLHIVNDVIARVALLEKGTCP